MDQKIIDILGIPYKIIEVEQVDNKDYYADGEVDYDKQIIKLNKNLEKDRKIEVLCHEVIHAIAEHLKIDEINNNEHLVQCLGNSIYQVFIRNKNINLV